LFAFYSNTSTYVAAFILSEHCTVKNIGGNQCITNLIGRNLFESKITVVDQWLFPSIYSRLPVCLGITVPSLTITEKPNVYTEGNKNNGSANYNGHLPTENHPISRCSWLRGVPSKYSLMAQRGWRNVRRDSISGQPVRRQRHQRRSTQLHPSTGQCIRN